MLYAFGDSFTYGFSLPEEERIHCTWPIILASKLGTKANNLSLPGASNWRTARKIQSLNIHKEDIVIISWSSVDRFEFGVNADYNPSATLIGDIVETDDDVKTKRFFRSLTGRTSDEHARQFNSLAYSKFYNLQWFIEMHKVAVDSCIYKLNSIGCRWLMFNAWTTNPKIDTPNYIFPNSTMYDNIVQRREGELMRYWTKEEHAHIAKIIYDKLYSDQTNEDQYEIYNANTNLDWYY